MGFLGRFHKAHSYLSKHFRSVIQARTWVWLQAIILDCNHAGRFSFRGFVSCSCLVCLGSGISAMLVSWVFRY